MVGLHRYLKKIDYGILAINGGETEEDGVGSVTDHTHH